MPVPDPVAFTIGNFEVRWYGVLIACGMALAVLLSCRRAPRHDLTADDVLDIVLFSIPAGILGARLYYVLFRWEYYAADPGQILNFRGGGLAVHGGLIAAFLTAYFVCRHKGIRFTDALDLCIPTVALAQAIGRWGNYFNSEAHGGHTDLPWAITVGGDTVHPTFLYESLWCFALFFLLTAIDRRRTYFGETSLWYGILYSAERIMVEQLRTDSLMIGPFKQAQVLSLIVILACFTLMVRRSKSAVIDRDAYLAGGTVPIDPAKKAVRR